jgi:KaiC/GvpD/RAD55 family RecA-like ATPase
MKYNIVAFDEVKIPKSFTKSLSTGIPNLDLFLSVQGGLVPSMSYMFTGVSGSGKTTISNYMMAGLAQPTSPAVFISLEMSKEQTKFQFEGKVDFKNVFIVDEIPHNTREGFTELLIGISELNPSVVVFDSLQMISAIIYGDPTSMKGQSDIADMVKNFSKLTGCPTILIGQCNKDGDYLGPTFVKHILDAHLHATIDKKSGERWVSFEKNRFGNVNETLGYAFRKDGSIYFESKEESKKSEYLGKPITWSKIEDTLTKLHFDIIHTEYKLLKGKPIPRLKFKGDKELPQNHPQYHPGINVWLNPDGFQNTVFIDAEWSLRVFQEHNIKNFYEDFLNIANRYQRVKTATDMFWLYYMVCMAHGLLNNSERNERFFKLLDKLVEKHL